VSHRQGGVVLFFWEPAPNFTVELVAEHGPNVLRFVLRTGNSSYAMVGSYSPSTDDGAELENIQKALDASPRGFPKWISMQIWSSCEVHEMWSCWRSSLIRAWKILSHCSGTGPMSRIPMLPGVCSETGLRSPHFAITFFPLTVGLFPIVRCVNLAFSARIIDW
jgi:hypothetical protein